MGLVPLRAILAESNRKQIHQGERMKKTLRELAVGESAVVTKTGGDGALRQHFLDMGMIPGTRVRVAKYAPMGDPVELTLHGYELTLRLADTEKIEVDTEAEAADHDISCEGLEYQEEEHPGLGEGGRYHDRSVEEPLPEGAGLRFALAGNQNSGKTTLYNQLTGANRHVGNFPGVTVDRKSGSIKGHPEASVTDLPGIYSLSPYSSEEVISRRYILEEKPECIIDIVDATNIERNLYLTMQLLELDVPMVLALNMMDEVRGNGGTIRINEMEAYLGIPVVPISASRGEGISELVDHALHIARYQEKPGRTDFCDRKDHGGAVHRCIHGIMHLIEDHAEAAGIPLRFAATKLIEGDSLVRETLALTDSEKRITESIIAEMEAECGFDRAAAMADMRFDFIMKLCAKTVVKPVESKEHERSSRMDRVLTGQYTAIPVFIAVMGLIFWLSFNVIGAFLQDLLAGGIGALGGAVDAWMTDIGMNRAVHSLITGAIFDGVGSVLSFIPIIVVLFFFLSILEDSGYMARVAFVTDKLLRKIGLSGRSIVPMLVGFGCSVPAIMASRTLPSERDRKLTILLTPFMSCSAKVPIYSYFCAAFFPGKGGWVMIALYLFGILMAVITALLTRKSLFRGKPVPFVLELPNYRMPGARNVLRLMWDKARDFIQRAFTVIFVATIVIWFLQSFDLHFDMVDDSADSMLASLSGRIAPVFGPLGFGDWRISTALVTGFMAKESVVATLAVLIKGAALTDILTVPASLSLLVFCLLYTPCVAAIAAVRRELGIKWALGVILFQCFVAWIAAFMVYNIFGLFL